MQRVKKRWRTWLLLAAVLLLALGLRLYRLDAQSLWNDEGTSVALAGRDLATIARNASHDIHPPLYYYLLHLWVGLTGNSVFSVRAFSVLAGVALVGGTYLLARRTMGTESALLAALFAALSPFEVYYSQEARMYILASLFGLVSMLAYSRLLDDNLDRTKSRLAHAAAYIVSSVLAVYTHYLALTLLLAQNFCFLVWLVRRQREQGDARSWPWRAILYWGGMQAVVVLCYLPWLIVSWGALTGWPAVSGRYSLTQLALQMARTLSFGVTMEDTLAVRIAAGALAVLALLGLFVPGRRQGEAEGPLRRRRLLEVGLYLLVPLAALWLLSLDRPLYKQKFVLLVAPAYHVLLAGGLLALGRWVGRRVKLRGARLVSVIVLSGLACGTSFPSLMNLYTNPAYARDDYRGIVAYIEATSQPEDAILINAPSQIETIDYYYDGPLPWYPLPHRRPLDQAQTTAEMEEMVAHHPRIYAIFWATDESDPEGFIEGWLDERTFKTVDRWYGNIRLVVYAVPPPGGEEMTHSLDYVLGDRIRLRGYSLRNPEPQSGDILQLTLFWEALAPIDTRYKVFTQILDAKNRIVGQRDSEPGGGRRLTTTWQPGERVADNYGLLIQPGTPPGEHTLQVGLYGLDDGQRLPVTHDGQALGDRVVLTTLSIRPAPVPPALATLDIQARDDAAWGALHLIGHSLHRLGYEHQPDTPVHPGDAVELILFWRKEGRAEAQDAFRLALEGGKGDMAWEETLQVTDGRFPLDAWREGEVVRDVHHYVLPATLPLRSYRLTLRPDGWGSGDTHIIARLVVEA